jgi:glycerol-3-phosphate dehydrogenase
VVVAAGPWTSGLVARTVGNTGRLPPARYALAVNLVVNRRLADVAVGVQARTGPGEDRVCGGHRFLFFVPHGEATLLGTWYTLAEGDPAQACEQGVRSLIREFNESCPGLELSAGEVSGYQWGRLPLKAGIESGPPEALAEQPRILDHGRLGGVRQLISVEGVKYTTARSVAARAVDLVFATLRRPNPGCRTHQVRLSGLSEGAALQPTDILHAVREEMARKLSDIVLRRTRSGSVAIPSRAVIEGAARVAGAELGWDTGQQESEVDEVVRQTGLPGRVMETVG